MRTRALTLFLFYIISFQALGQSYGNEWINYDQTYYKIPVGKEDIYRLTYDDLVNAGIPVGTVDARKIQVFHRGVEQAIIVDGELDARMDPQDYILFYGRRNDGTLDKRLYTPQEAQPHPYYNLYSDTTAYFLTWKLTGSNGKRMQAFKETNTSGIPAEEAHFPVIRKVNFEQYAKGRTFNTYTQYSQFDMGEGWTGERMQENQSRQYTISGITNRLAAAGNPQINVFLQGREEMLHRAEISVGKDVGSLRVLGTQDFEAYGSAIYNATINWQDISASGDLIVKITALGPEGNDFLSVSYIEVIYPQSFDQQGQAFRKYWLKENPADKSYMVIQNIPAGTIIFDVTDPHTVRRIGYDQSGNNSNLIVSGTNVARQLLSVSQYTSPSLRKVNFRRYDPADAGYVIITHPSLNGVAGGYQQAVTAYATYRNSATGGGYDTLVADILQLYDQFNYGEVSPLAIFDFVRWLKDNSSPQFLFFIGEGLEILYNFHRNPDAFTFKDLVPTAGLPASDIIYSAGLDGFASVPAIPTGRLTASTSQQVVNYLEKVKVMETLPYDELWRKRVLHLSGGLSDFELVNFRFFMDGFAKIAEGPYLGGEVSTIQKNSRTTSEFINIADEVNTGLNLVTFFGHSAPSVTDIDIGFVTNPLLGYNNKDKYPVFLVNGCQAGQFFLNTFLFGEDWIMAAEKGAIGFIAHTSYGYPFDLRDYTSTFYKVGYGDENYISERLGEIQQEVIRRLEEDKTLDPEEIALNQQMMLLGDPATLLFGADKPDYDIVEGSAFVSSFNGAPVTALTDSFAVNVLVKNYGIAPPDTLEVRIQRSIDGREISLQDTIFPAIMFQDTLSLIIHRKDLQGFGENTFTITLDSNNEKEEYNENNNTLTFTYFLNLNGTRNLLPYNFAVINEDLPDIFIQSTDNLLPIRSFEIHLDTSSVFNSPVLKSVTVDSRLLAKWIPGFLNKDTVTYFLRSKFSNPEPGDVNEWATTSFTRVEGGETGWAQRTPAQFESNGFEGLSMDPVTGRFLFEEKVLPVSIRTIGSLHPDDIIGVSVLLENTEYNIDNQRRCRNNTLNIIAFDKETIVPYAPIPFSFLDVRTCGRQPQVINSYRRNEMVTGNNDDIEEVINRIGIGDSVLLFTIGNPEISLWDPIVKTQLESLGISSASWGDLVDGQPVVIKARKGVGDAEVIVNEETPVEEQELTAHMTFTGIASSGTMSTGLIGPAEHWGRLTINASNDGEDEIEISISGYSLQGDQSFLLQTTAVKQDLSFINAEEFPYLRISAAFKDSRDLTPPILNSWFVTYSPSPEGILLPTSFDEKKELQEGDSLMQESAFYNFSPWAFTDSLEVRYSLRNNGTLATDLKSFKIPGPASGDTISFSTNFGTVGKAGLNDYSVYVNPKLVAEQYYENNQIVVADYLDVIRDNASPLLDVRFDGQQIFDRDIVSPNPLISIVLKDENTFLVRDDTTGIQIFLKREYEGCDFERVAFASDKIMTHSDPDKNNFTIEYYAGPLEDGIYTLRVQASDVSGNNAGEKPYEIQFEVINESMVTNFYPYPNPFSSKVRFIFTLTGNALPDQMLIRILTVSGRVIKEISLEEFGMLRIGNNISEYAWDGRDEFGDKLANGVYLYKVILKKNGKDVSHRVSAGDDMFKNGYGKLYLLR